MNFIFVAKFAYHTNLLKSSSSTSARTHTKRSKEIKSKLISKQMQRDQQSEEKNPKHLK